MTTSDSAPVSFKATVTATPVPIKPASKKPAAKEKDKNQVCGGDAPRAFMFLIALESVKEIKSTDKNPATNVNKTYSEANYYVLFCRFQEAIAKVGVKEAGNIIRDKGPLALLGEAVTSKTDLIAMKVILDEAKKESDKIESQLPPDIKKKKEILRTLNQKKAELETGGANTDDINKLQAKIDPLDAEVSKAETKLYEEAYKKRYGEPSSANNRSDKLFAWRWTPSGVTSSEGANIIKENKAWRKYLMTGFGADQKSANDVAKLIVEEGNKRIQALDKEIKKNASDK